MDYLKLLCEDSNLAAEFDMLFDFCLLDGLEERDTAEGRCTFSLPGKAFARDGAGGEYHQLEDGSIGYMSSEGECGRIAESVDDLIHLLVYSICWHDYCDASQYTDISLSKPMPMSVMMKSLLIQKWMNGKPLFRRSV